MTATSRPRRAPAELARAVLMALLLVVAGCSTSDWSARARADMAGPLPAGTAHDAYERGKTHLRLGQFGLALEAFRTALRWDQAPVDSLNGIGVTYDELGRFDISRRYFQQALELDPESPQTLNNFGRSLLRQGKVEAALALFEGAARSAGDNGVIMANLELTGRRLAHADEQTVNEATPTGAAERLPPWVELTSIGMQTLVTIPAHPRNAGERTPQHWAAHVASLEAASGDGGARAVPALASRRAESPDPEAASAPRLEVSNGAGRRHMAARMRTYLARHGLEVDRLTNAESFAYQDSIIFFRPGRLARAKEVAELLPHPVRLEEKADQWSEVSLRLGGDLLDFDLTLLSS